MGGSPEDRDHAAPGHLVLRRGEEGDDFREIGRRFLGPEISQVPDYVSFYFATEGRNMSPGHPGFLGARFGSMDLYMFLFGRFVVRMEPGEK